MSHVISFVHANGLPAPTYQYFFEQLKYPVIAKHQYAHDSKFPLVNHWQHQPDELLAYLDQQGATQDVIALGHSFGGVISFLAAIKEPQRFKALIMLDPPLITSWASGLFEWAKSTPLIDKITPAGITQARKSRWPVGTDLVAYFQSKRFFKDFEPRCIADYVNSVTSEVDSHIQLSYQPQIEANVFRTIPTNLGQYKGQLKVPSLLITGQQTDVTMPFLYKPFVRQHPGMHVGYIAGGHMFVLERPEETAERINAFIEQYLLQDSRPDSLQGV